VRRINFFPCHRLPAALAVQEGRKEGKNVKGERNDKSKRKE
jgi:hypothetical protein